MSTSPVNTAQMTDGAGLIWIPILSVTDGLTAIHDLGHLISPPDVDFDLFYASVSHMMEGLFAADTDSISTSNPHLSSRTWHTLMTLNQLRAAMGQLLRFSGADLVLLDIPQKQKQLFDLMESKWADIVQWLDYLRSKCLSSSTRTCLTLDQRHPIFTIILDFIQTCFYSISDSDTERHIIHSLILNDCFPISARLWYGKAVRTSFRDLVDPPAATLFAGTQQEVTIYNRKFDWVVEKICDWVHISRERLAIAFLIELQQRNPDPYPRMSHLSYNMVLTELFDSMDPSFSRHLIFHSSLHIVTRVLYQVRCGRERRLSRRSLHMRRICA